MGRKRRHPGQDRPRSHRALAGLAVLAVAAGLAYLFASTRPPAAGAPQAAATAPPEFVGGKACAECHAREHAAWQGSQHDRAMQVATESTVLGDFSGAKFRHAGVTSTFFRRDGRFFVNTDGPDGRLADFEISHTFGVEPLQQYLVSFPDGRRQALGIAWDSRPKPAGGQRWFHLYPGQGLKAGDRLHWTAIDQNWNYQCADCHSTNLRKNFDEASNTFRTTWTDMNVGCEACHGPGSRHVEWARTAGNGPGRGADNGLTVALDERRGVAWLLNTASGSAARSRPRDTSREIEACARCHARRGQFTDEHAAGQPFSDGFRPALLEPGLYHPDGQMRDEVYNYGSFLQSRMNAHGVTCSDCHDPHSQKLRAPGNGVCAQCHAPAKFDDPAHHHHPPGSTGARCAACHMPTTTHMVVDPRHDHAMRIPRPDLSEKLGTRNACTDCHADRKAPWAARAVAGWYPQRKEGFQDFAEAFAGADRGEPAALARLEGIAADRARPAIVRASAIARLARRPGPATFATLRGALDDPDALVRAAAVSGLAGVEPATRAAVVARMAGDPSRLVRMEAARVLAGTPADPALLEHANAEFLAAQRFNADRPESHVALGEFAAARGESEAAIAAFRKAIAIDPGSALAHHALGLALVRNKRLAEAIGEFARATALAPDEARFANVYAVALFDGGRRAEALRVLDAAIARHPNDRELLFVAATYRAEVGDSGGALRLALRLRAIDPGSPQVQELVRALARNAR